MRGLIDLARHAEDEKVRLVAQDKVIERAWGRPKDFDPTQDSERPQLDAEALSDEERAMLLRLLGKAAGMSDEELKAEERRLRGPAIDGNVPAGRSRR